MEKSLIFIGMSGIGKTHWTRQIGGHLGIDVIEMDNLIGQSTEFSSLIKDWPGSDTCEKLGNYFGKPWEPGYEEKETAYLEIERKLMAQCSVEPGSAIDLSGSAVYHPTELSALADSGTIVYLKASSESFDEVLETYLANPKPIAWKGAFHREDGETNEDALARSFEQLLHSREELYEQFCHVSIEYDVHRKCNNAEELLSYIPT